MVERRNGVNIGVIRLIEAAVTLLQPEGAL